MAHLTAENAATALNDILENIAKPENALKIDEARANTGNEMLKMMQYIFPLIMEIQNEVIQKHGFAEGREGIVQFAQLIRSLEREDAEVARLHNLVRAHYLPPVAISSSADNSSHETPPVAET